MYWFWGPKDFRVQFRDSERNRIRFSPDKKELKKMLDHLCKLLIAKTTLEVERGLLIEECCKGCETRSLMAFMNILLAASSHRLPSPSWSNGSHRLGCRQL